MSSLSRPWRSIAEWDADPAFLARAAQEFPGLAEALAAPQSRRNVLKLMAAAFAMSGLDGCDVGAPGGRFTPAVKPPANIIPGLPNFYSTAHVLDGFATGVVVKHVMGRPIKVEGNPLHPASLGATDIFCQAQVLDFYDPDRASAMAFRQRPSDRQSFLTALATRRLRLAGERGEGFRILTGTVTSPTLSDQLDLLLHRYPQARWHQWDPISRENARHGAQLAFAQGVDLVPKPAAADVLLAIDSDLLSSAPGHLRFARELTSRRNPTRASKMSRLYAIEPTPSLVGAMADHRFIAEPRELPRLVSGLASIILQGSAPAGLPDWLGRIAADLVAHPGKALVHVGPHASPEVHALAHAINDKLDASGNTLDFIEPVARTGADGGESLRDLVTDMHAGRVSTLIIIDSNPVFAAPGALDFAQALARVEFSVALSQTPDETFGAVTWSIPMTHPWETWGDARAFDGATTILQPQALPLYEGISAHQMLALWDEATTANEGFPDTLAMVQGTWRSRFSKDFEGNWHQALADGVVVNTASPVVSPTLRPQAVRDVLAGTASVVTGTAPPAAGAAPRPATTAAPSTNAPPAAATAPTPTAAAAPSTTAPPATAAAPPSAALTILFRPDPHLWDGRYANNAWLQELPRPLTKLTWDNPLLISPELASTSKLRNGDEVRLTIGKASVTAPVWIMPGQAANTVIAPLGFGRRQSGHVAEASGVDYYPLVGHSGAPTLRKTGAHTQLASTDHHQLIFNVAGDLIKHGTLAAYRQNPHFLAAERSGAELYRWPPEGPAAWGMSIDLNTCIGCNACVVACQSENNIPVVGREQVIHEREMHWLRIDRYWEGPPAAPRAYFQPVLCMHCEQAPCEVVCPVGATVHDSEGLNVMVYNRCVGTRFCSNNCPYKVRRFNYFDYAQQESRPPRSRNPDVTVRARGVMEKCTFCIQRIAEARIAADRDNRPVGTVTTACQAACPTQAITFGNLRDRNAEVAKRKQSPLDYSLLPEQNTHPRVTYEARIHNPNIAPDEESGT